MNKPNSERHNQDLRALALGYLSITRCPGGRPVVKGYVCAHCGIDYTDDENKGFCGQPVGEDGYTVHDATMALRIMRDSARKYGEDE